VKTNDVIHMPHWQVIARQALSNVIIVSLVPMGLFAAVHALAGLRPAVVAVAAWYYAGILFRLMRRQPVLGVVALGAGLLTIRTAVTFVTSSATIYFLQPVASTVATATVFAATALAGRPIIDRLAHDFCPLPPELSDRLRQRRFFNAVSVVWAVTYIVNAAGTIWLLTSASINGFVMIKSVMGPALTALAVVTSYLLFRRLARREGFEVRWGHPQVAAAAA
jgi:uncharacterized membrane protein